MTTTPIVKTVTVGGHEVRVHALPWKILREAPDADASPDEKLDYHERIVRECCEVPDGVDLLAVATTAEVFRLCELTNERDANPGF